MYFNNRSPLLSPASTPPLTEGGTPGIRSVRDLDGIDSIVTIDEAQYTDLNNDGSEEALVVGHGPESDGSAKTFFSIFEYDASRRKWISRYDQELWSYPKEALLDIDDLVLVDVSRDLTSDGLKDIYLVVGAEGSFGGILSLAVISYTNTKAELVFEQGFIFRTKASVNENSNIIIEEANFAPDDEECCPSSTIITTYEYDGETFVLAKETRRKNQY